MIPAVGQPRHTESGRPQRLLDLISGWPLWVALCLCMTAVGWRGWEIYETKVLNEGVYDNGFDLSTLIVDNSLLRHANMKLDALRPLTDPEVLSPEALAGKRRKFMVNRDRVIGVEINGEARAYPLRILNWHEIVNDELGGELIAVAYSPLTDSVAVYDRRVDGEELNFRMSGLLMHSNLLMYDPRLDFDDRSLWSQIEGRAVSGLGGARGARLETFPCTLLPYAKWQERHPETTVIDGREALFKKCYRKNPYVTYFQINSPPPEFFPEDQLPDSGPPPMTKILSVRAGSVTRDLTYPEIAEHCTGDDVADSTWNTEVGGVPVTVHYQDNPPCAWLAAEPGSDVQVEHALWFALHAKRRAAAH